jgi:hypothetical protein
VVLGWVDLGVIALLIALLNIHLLERKCPRNVLPFNNFRIPHARKYHPKTIVQSGLTVPRGSYG